MAYATVSELRAMEGLGDASVFSDASLTDAIAFATVLVDTYTGARWEPTTVTLDLPTIPSSYLFTNTPFIRSITSCTIGGEAQDVTGWIGTQDGWVIRPSGTFGARVNAATDRVSITMSVGADSPPADIAWAVRAIARQYLLDLVSRAPDRALSVASEYGTIQLAQPGGVNRPTSMPEVNAVLNRHVVKRVVAG